MIEAKVGKQVVIIHRDGCDVHSVLKLATITFVGKRDIVCDNGTRFRVSDQTAPPPNGWTANLTLRDVDDPEVLAIQRVRRTARHASEIEALAAVIADGTAEDPAATADAIAVLAGKLAGIIRAGSPQDPS